jgi:uncharacterized membrane protein
MIPLLILTIGFILPAAVPERPDSNFKSIHQVQAEEHASDTLQPDTAVKPPLPNLKAVGYATYFLVVVLLLIILLVVLILIRSRQKIKRE